MTQGLDPLHAKLELTTDLLELRYCSDYSFQFVLRLNFSNKGTSTVVLDKKSRRGSSFLVSPTLEDAIKRKYEFTADRLMHMLPTYDPADRVPNESDFMVLKPGESYCREDTVRLYNPKSLRTGHHVLQIVVENWPYFASNIEWRERWRSRGYLWTDPITSVPMRFVIERKPTTVECR